MARLFGTDGVRGVVNEFLTPELAYHLFCWWQCCYRRCYPNSSSSLPRTSTRF